MRRAAVILLPLALAISACGSGESSSETTEETSSSTETTDENETGSTIESSDDSTPTSADTTVPPTFPPLEPASAPEGCEERPPATTVPPIEDPVTKPEIDLPTGEVTELKITDLETGEGREAEAGDVVSVYYVGVLSADGEEFDSNYGSGQPFPVNLGVGSVIQGWDQGLIGAQRGTLRQLDIPSDLAYGPAGSEPTIPPDADLTFIVQVVGVEKGAQAPAADAADEPDLELTPVTGEVEYGFEDLAEGEGCDYAQIDDIVYVNVVTYNGTDLSTLDSSFQFGESYTIELNAFSTYGLVQGIIGMRVGGERLITIPPEAGFGPEGNESAGLEPDTVLLVWVQLVAIEGVTEVPPPPTTIPLDTTPLVPDSSVTGSAVPNSEAPDGTTPETTDGGSTTATWPSSGTTQP